MRFVLRMPSRATYPDLPQELFYFLSMTLLALLVANLSMRAGVPQGAAFLIALVLIPLSLLAQSLFHTTAEARAERGGSVTAGWFLPRAAGCLLLAACVLVETGLVGTLMVVLTATALFSFGEARLDCREDGGCASRGELFLHALVPLMLGTVLLFGDMTGRFFS